MVAIFSKLCLWRRSLCSNLGGIGPEKLYRATLIDTLFKTLNREIKTQDLENHTLFSGTYAHRPNKGVSPPPGGLDLALSLELSELSVTEIYLRFLALVRFLTVSFLPKIIWMLR